MCRHVQVVEDHFMEGGPNGVHLCLVYPFAGLSVRSMSDSRGRVPGSRRLLADLAKKVAKQTATAVDLLHSAGLVHGGSAYSGVQAVHSTCGEFTNYLVQISRPQISSSWPLSSSVDWTTAPSTELSVVNL